MGKDIKEVNDLLFMAKWHAYRAQELFEKNPAKESPLYRPFDDEMKEKFQVT